MPTSAPSPSAASALAGLSGKPASDASKAAKGESAPDSLFSGMVAAADKDAPKPESVGTNTAGQSDRRGPSGDAPDDGRPAPTVASETVTAEPNEAAEGLNLAAATADPTATATDPDVALLAATAQDANLAAPSEAPPATPAPKKTGDSTENGAAPRTEHQQNANAGTAGVAPDAAEPHPRQAAAQIGAAPTPSTSPTADPQAKSALNASTAATQPEEPAAMPTAAPAAPEQTGSTSAGQAAIANEAARPARQPNTPPAPAATATAEQTAVVETAATPATERTAPATANDAVVAATPAAGQQTAAPSGDGAQSALADASAEFADKLAPATTDGGETVADKPSAPAEASPKPSPDRAAPRTPSHAPSAQAANAAEAADEALTGQAAAPQDGQTTAKAAAAPVHMPTSAETLAVKATPAPQAPASIDAAETARTEEPRSTSPIAIAGADSLEASDMLGPRTDPSAQAASRRFAAAMSQQAPTAQVAFTIARGVTEATDRIRLHLYPRELGEVEVRLDVQDDRRTEVVIRAERAETVDLLQRDARELQRALQAAGLDVDSGDLSFELGGGDADADRDGDGSLADARQTSELGDGADAERLQPPPAYRWRTMTPGGVDMLA